MKSGKTTAFHVLQGLGMVLLALGVQGAIRQLADHEDLGFVSWLPGYSAALTAHLAAVVIGTVLALWGARRAKAAGRQR